MVTSQKFIANYSRIHQSSRRGLSLGIGFCVTGHMPGSFGGKCGRPGRSHRTGPEAWFLPLEGAPWSERVRTQRLSLQSLPGAQQAGTRRPEEGGDVSGGSRESVERREREGRHRSPGRGVSR